MKRLVVLFVLLGSFAHAGAYMTFGRYIGGRYGDEPDTQSGAVWDASVGVFETFGWFTPYGSIQTIMNGTGGGGFNPSRVIYKLGFEAGSDSIKLVVEHMCDHHVDPGPPHVKEYYNGEENVLVGEEHKNQQYNFVGVRYNFW